MKKHLFKTVSLVMAFALALGGVSLFAACNGEGDSAHVHTFETTWTSDATNHWHKATCEHTTEVSGKAAHTFGADNKCTVCGYQRQVAEHTHTFEEAWTSDEHDHWHKATCGDTTEVSGKAAHTFGADNRCTVCGYEKKVDKTAKCDVYCPICGKCIDLIYCTEDTEKCGDALQNRFTFEAEEAVFGEGARFPEVQNVYQTPEEEEEDAHYVGYMQGNIGASLTFTITANKACIVNLRIRCGCVDDSVFTDTMTTVVNDEILEAKVISPKSHKRNFAWITLGCISLNAGENTIEFIVAASTNEGNSAKNMDKIELRAEDGVELTWQYTDNTQYTSDSIKDTYVTPSERKK